MASFEASHQSSKGSKKKRLIFEYGELLCEWNLCPSVFKKMEYYLEHIKEHIQNYTVPPCADGYMCLWRECDGYTDTLEDLVRHIYYHGFHTKIKSIGQEYCSHNDIKCAITDQTRNIINETPHDFICMWKDCLSEHGTFMNIQDFYWHVQMHVMQSDKNENKVVPCQWKGCKSTFTGITRLRDHTRTHTQEKVIACPTCGQVYASNTNFSDHIVKQQPVEHSLFQCSLCSRKYANEKFLREHVKNHVNAFKCPFCEMTCTSRSTLKVHIGYRHPKHYKGKVKYKCPHCDKFFFKAHDMSRHIMTHTQAALVCHVEDCNYSCRAANTLRNHIKKVHEGGKKYAYACHLCESKHFTEGYVLSNHLVSAHNYRHPEGHVRFRYKRDDDGFYRLQTVRYESEDMVYVNNDGQLILPATEEGDDPMEDPLNMQTPSKNHSFGEDEIDVVSQ